MSYADFTSNVAFLAQKSNSESLASKKNVWRATALPTSGESLELHNFMRDFEGDVLILRTLEPFTGRSLDVSKWAVIDCGELTYWGANGMPTDLIDETYQLIPANMCIDEFKAVVRSSFKGYKNHYSFNPMFNSISPVEAYVDWGVNLALSEDPSSFALVMRHNDVSIGVILAEGKERYFEIQLAGISSDFQRLGHYTNMIKKFWQQFVIQNELPIVISTQSDNLSVQQAWKKLGLTEEFKVFTSHICRKKY